MNLPLPGAPGGGAVENEFVVVGTRRVFGQVEFLEEVTNRDHNRTLDGEQRMTREFLAYTSHPLVASTTVVAFDQRVTPFPVGQPGAELNTKVERRVPRPGDKHVELDDQWNVVHTNDHVVCVDVRAEQADDDHRKWRVVARYAGVGDPLAEPADVCWDNVPYQVALLVEADAESAAIAKPILNSAGDPFVEGVVADRRRYTLTVVKNMLTWNPWEVTPYQDSINAQPFLAAQHPPGFAPGTCKLNLSAQRVRRSGNNDFYYRRKAVVEINLGGWDAKVRDAGFRYKDPASGRLPNVADHPAYAGRHAPATAHLLKPNGDVALPFELRNAAGDVIRPADPTPDLLVFKVYKRKNWGTPNLEY